MEASRGSTWIIAACWLGDILHHLGINKVTIFLLKLLKICKNNIPTLLSVVSMNIEQCPLIGRVSIDRDQLHTMFRHTAAWKDRHKPQTKQKHTYISHWDRSGEITFGLALCLISKAHLFFYYSVQYQSNGPWRKASDWFFFFCFLPVACSFCLFIQTRTSCPWVTPVMVLLRMLPHQSLIKMLSYRTSHRRQFLGWGSLFPVNSIFCQVDQNYRV